MHLSGIFIVFCPFLLWPAGCLAKISSRQSGLYIMKAFLDLVWICNNRDMQGPDQLVVKQQMPAFFLSLPHLCLFWGIHNSFHLIWFIRWNIALLITCKKRIFGFLHFVVSVLNGFEQLNSIQDILWKIFTCNCRIPLHIYRQSQQHFPNC